MTRYLKIILWQLPGFGAAIGFVVAFCFYTGAAKTWQFVGNPGVKVSEIIGYTNLKFYIKTKTGDIYSFIFLPTSEKLPSSILWEKEQDQSIVVDPPENLSWVKFVTLPPLFKIKQLYEAEYSWGESFNEVKFALSADGDLWFWTYGMGGLGLITYIVFPIFGLIGGGIIVGLLIIGKIIWKLIANAFVHGSNVLL